MTAVAVERCDECGFDGAAWTDEAAIAAVAALGERWREATEGLDLAAVGRRPDESTWSIAEYADHVREVLFAMRFLLDSAADAPGIDLGEAPEPEFARVAKAIDLDRAVGGVEREASALASRLREVPLEVTAVVGGDVVDGHWIARHAVHDATHHLLDVERLSAAAPS